MSSGNSFNSFRVADFSFESSGGCMLSNTIPLQDFGGYLAEFKKFLSCVSIALHSFTADAKSLGQRDIVK